MQPWLVVSGYARCLSGGDGLVVVGVGSGGVACGARPTSQPSGRVLGGGHAPKNSHFTMHYMGHQVQASDQNITGVVAVKGQGIIKALFQQLPGSGQGV